MHNNFHYFVSLFNYQIYPGVSLHLISVNFSPSNKFVEIILNCILVHIYDWRNGGLSLHPCINSINFIALSP